MFKTVQVIVVGCTDGETHRNYGHVDVGPGGFFLHVVLSLRITHTARERYFFEGQRRNLCCIREWCFGKPKSTLFDGFEFVNSDRSVYLSAFQHIAFIKCEKRAFGDLNLPLGGRYGIPTMPHR